MIYIFSIFIVGCSSQKKLTGHTEALYQKLESGLENLNQSDNDTFYFKSENFNPVKIIFEKLENKLQTTDSLIFVFSWINHLPMAGANHLESIVYDLEKEKTYYLYNYRNDYKNIIVQEIRPDDFNTIDMVFENFQKGDIEYLKNQQNQFSSAEMGQDYLILKIHLGKDFIDTLVLESITLK